MSFINFFGTTNKALLDENKCKESLSGWLSGIGVLDKENDYSKKNELTYEQYNTYVKANENTGLSKNVIDDCLKKMGLSIPVSSTFVNDLLDKDKCLASLTSWLKGINVLEENGVPGKKTLTTQQYNNYIDANKNTGLSKDVIDDCLKKLGVINPTITTLPPEPPAGAGTESGSETNPSVTSSDSAETKSETKPSATSSDSAEKLSVNFYSYDDKYLGPIVKMKINGPNNVPTSDVEIDSEQINKGNYKEKVNTIVSKLTSVGSFPANFNRDVTKEVNRGIVPGKVLEAETPKQAIAELEILMNNSQDQKTKEEALALKDWLKEKPENSGWKSEEYTGVDKSKSSAQDKYRSLLSKAKPTTKGITPVDTGPKIISIKASLDKIKTNLGESNTQKAGIDSAILEIEKPGVEMSWLNQIEKNVASLKIENNQIVKTQGVGLLGRKTVLTADQVKDEILRKSMASTAVNMFKRKGGKKTLKRNKKTKKGGRRQNKTKKH
jgi:hypothetical protein